MCAEKFNDLVEADVVQKLADQALNLPPEGQRIATNALHDEMSNYTPREVSQIVYEINKRYFIAYGQYFALNRLHHNELIEHKVNETDLTKLNDAQGLLNHTPRMDFIATKDEIRGVVFSELGKTDGVSAVTPVCGHYPDACERDRNSDFLKYSDGTIIEDAIDQRKWSDFR